MLSRHLKGLSHLSIISGLERICIRSWIPRNGFSRKAGKPPMTSSPVSTRSKNRKQQNHRPPQEARLLSEAAEALSSSEEATREADHSNEGVEHRRLAVREILLEQDV